MKYCPQCKAQYDNEMSFCLQDGTPLQLSGVSTSSENISEKTLAIPRPNSPHSSYEPENTGNETLAIPQTAIPKPNDQLGSTMASPILPISQPTVSPISQPTIIPTDNWNNRPTNPQQPASMPNQVFVSPQPPPRKSYLGALIGVAGVGLVLIASAIGGVLYFQSQPGKDFAANTTNLNRSNQLPAANTTPGTTGNVSLPVFGDNSAPNTNKPVANSTEKTTPKPTASAENSPKTNPPAENKPDQDDTPVPKTPVPNPSKSTPQDVPKIVSGGVVNGKAVNLVRPPYPPAARAVHASGTVNVQVTIDENGNVISASAVSGHPLLKQAAENAARASKFSPTVLAGQRVKVTGVIVYNFSEQ